MGLSIPINYGVEASTSCGTLSYYIEYKEVGSCMVLSKNAYK